MKAASRYWWLFEYSVLNGKLSQILHLSHDDSFDVVVAGNVIHLIPDPQNAMKELTRVCKDGGKLIIPTYINGDEGTNKLVVKILEQLGANFKRQFDSESYEKFFAEMGYEDVAYEVVRGRMSCDIAVIEVKKKSSILI